MASKPLPKYAAELSDVEYRELMAGLATCIGGRWDAYVC